MTTATSHGTIEKIRQSFSVHGLPQMLVSDNATCFTSAEFDEGWKGAKVTYFIPFLATKSANGLAERAVWTFKEGMKRRQGGSESLEAKVSRFPFSYRITPHSTTGLSPAEMLMSRKPRSAFDLLLPDLKSKVEKKQWKQKVNHDTRTKFRSFSPGNPVFIKNYGYGPKSIPGKIESCTGPLSCTVVIGNGQVVRRHVDQIRKRELNGVIDLEPSIPQAVSIPSPVMPKQVQSPEVQASDALPHVKDSESGPPMLGSESPLVLEEQLTPPLRRSIRERCPPHYYRPQLKSKYK